ncbi:MAG TPA: hypothetical protein VMB03_26475 [Bryobacteraceae bacterium]|nr:hypothetical protein [Bryobacteraceae bacterium]
MRSRRPWLVLTAVIAFLGLNSCKSSTSSSKIYDIGSRVEMGHLIYTVFETQWLPQLGAGDTARVPQHRFFVVRLSAVNSGSEEMDVPNVTLIPDQGDPIEELSDGDQVPQWIGFVRKVKPADSISGNVVFDAEPRHYRLKLMDEDGEKSALVDIPLNFNADAPPGPLPTAGSGTDFSSPPPPKK